MIRGAAHKDVTHPAGQVSTTDFEAAFDKTPVVGEFMGLPVLGLSPTGGELKLSDAFIPDPFGAKVESPEFYLAKIAKTLEDIETLMSEMLRKMS
jgi:hypothetical protein